MNENRQFGQNKRLTKSRLQLAAAVSTAIAILVLLICIRVFLGENFLKDGDPINPGVVHAIRGMIRTSTYIIMPALSVLLIINSYLLWACSREFYPKLEK